MVELIVTMFKVIFLYECLSLFNAGVSAYKVVSAASLIAANVVPKGATSLIGSKTSGITLLQPAPKHTSVVSHIGR